MSGLRVLENRSGSWLRLKRTPILRHMRYNLRHDLRPSRFKLGLNLKRSRFGLKLGLKCPRFMSCLGRLKFGSGTWSRDHY
jgi:hypothetical protein